MWQNELGLLYILEGDNTDQDAPHLRALLPPAAVVQLLVVVLSELFDEQKIATLDAAEQEIVFGAWAWQSSSFGEV